MNLRRLHDISLKWKLLIPFLFLASVGASALFLVSYRFQADLIHLNEEKRLKSDYQYFLNDIDAKTNMAMSLAYLVANNPNVTEAFAKRDRKRLIELLCPAYQRLQENFGIKQFHFHVPPATSFLRLHALDRFGDKMEAYRHTINKARENGTGIGGLEQGAFGLSIRSVVPVFHEEKLIGTVEFGLSFEESLLQEFKKDYGADLTLYVEKGSGVDEPRVFASTLNEVRVPSEIFKQCFYLGKIAFYTSKWVGRDIGVIAGPVRDFSSNIVAVVEIGVDRTPTLALLREYGTIAVIIGLAGLIVSMAFVWLVSVFFTKRIEKVVEAADDIAAGQRDARIAVKSADELGVMARAINEMLVSLEESRGKIKDYADNLELMVEQRTWALKESEQTYRTLVEHVPVIVYLVMPDGAAIFLNTFVEETIGLSAQELSGHHEALAEFIHPHDRTRVLSYFDECLHQREECRMEYRMIHKDGHTVYVVDHAIPVLDENNELVRMDGIIIDVTARKELQEKIVQAEELETLSGVSARLAHEIRNPLTSIGGLTRRLLKSFEASDPRRQKGELIVKEVKKLERILKMITAYIEPRTVRLRPSDLNKVVTMAVDRTRAELEDKSFSVKAYLDEDLPEIRLDRDLFEKVLVNLMKNAFYRMTQGNGIEVTTGKSGGYVTVTLAYKVSFISDDDIEQFFYPFVVDYPFRKEVADEDIMDLPICRVLIRKHGGIINVEKGDKNLLNITISVPYE